MVFHDIINNIVHNWVELMAIDKNFVKIRVIDANLAASHHTVEGDGCCAGWVCW